MKISKKFLIAISLAVFAVLLFGKPSIAKAQTAEELLS
jgi:hypothetical protein